AQRPYSPAAEPRRHLVGEIEERQWSCREVRRVPSLLDDGDTFSPARRDESADPAAADSDPGLQPTIRRGAYETPADVFLAPVESMRPRDVEIHEPRPSLFHAWRMGQRHVEQILRSLGASLTGQETGDASQSGHRMSQDFAPPLTGRARERSTSASDVIPP